MVKFNLEIPTNAIFFNILPMIIPVKDMNHVHTWIRSLFLQEIPNVLSVERLPHFLQKWKIFTQNPNIFLIVENCRILFLSLQ